MNSYDFLCFFTTFVTISAIKTECNATMLYTPFSFTCFQMSLGMVFLKRIFSLKMHFYQADFNSKCLFWLLKSALEPITASKTTNCIVFNIQKADFVFMAFQVICKGVTLYKLLLFQKIHVYRQNQVISTISGVSERNFLHL